MRCIRKGAKWEECVIGGDGIGRGVKEGGVMGRG